MQIKNKPLLLFFIAFLIGLAGCSLGLTQKSTNWSQWGGNDAGTRYSDLDEINTNNVHKLTLAWAFSPHIAGGYEGGPLIVDDIIYLHTPFPNRVYALDQHTHDVIWQYTPAQNEAETITHLEIDTISRGLAYAQGKIFLQQANTVLTALDAKTGKLLWQVQNGDPKQGMSNTNAPIVVKDKVITGISGGGFGVRGYLAAYDINTGHLIWKGYSIGSDHATLIRAGKTTTWRNGKVSPLKADESLSSWQGEQWKTGGGATWGWYSYDPELNLIYYGSGSPAPMSSTQRPGDNKWTNALWARNADTGEVAWVYQVTPHDEWDYDATHESVLIGQKINGVQRKTLVHFDKNGFVYTLDRKTGELLKADKYDASTNWASHIDLYSGRPQRVEQYSPENTGEDIFTEGICPSVIGSKGQNPVSYSPETKLFYVAGNQECMDLETFEMNYTAGLPFMGFTSSIYSLAKRVERIKNDTFFNKKGPQGFFSAWDANTGQTVWSISEALNVMSGSLATAGNIVFYGTLDGYLKAVDASTGQLLYQFKTPSGIIGNISTWQYQGKQYIGVLSGVGGIKKWDTNYSTAALSVFSVFAMPETNTDIPFIKTYPKELFQLNTLDNPDFDPGWQVKFKPENISLEVHKLVSQIHYLNEVVELQGAFSNHNFQDDNFIALKNTASQQELIELTRHPSGVVRYYAILALTYHPEVDIEKIVLEHLNDNEEIAYQTGCNVWSKSVGDSIINAVKPDSDIFNKSQRNNKLTATQFHNIQLALAKTDSTLLAASKALTSIEPLPSLYPRIRSLVKDDKNQAALVALAKYHKNQDIDLILNSSGNSNNRKEGYTYTYQAISQFPAPRFFPFLEKNFLLETSREYTFHFDLRPNVAQNYYNAIASFQDRNALKLLSKALKLLDYPFKSLRNRSIKEISLMELKNYHNSAIFNAISQFKSPIYDPLLWKLWEQDNLLTEDVFLYLSKKSPKRAVALLKNSFQDIISYSSNYYSFEVSSPYYEIKNSIKIINFLFDFLYKEDPNFAINLVKYNISNKEGNFSIFIKKASEIKSSSFIEPLIQRLETEQYYYKDTVRTLFSYNNNALTKRVIGIIEKSERYSRIRDDDEFKDIFNQKKSTVQ